MMRQPPNLTRMLRDTDGATIIEFALVAPVLLMFVLGIFDLGYNVYAKTLLEGAVQKAARDSTIEAAEGREAAIDAKVTRAVRDIVPSAEISFDRKSYASFSDVAKPEDFTDANEDGICNDNEPYEDANGNGSWDDDRGKTGFGGARDAVLYTVNIEYDRAFPLMAFVGVPDRITTSASTVLRNQPFNIQDVETGVGNCE